MFLRANTEDAFALFAEWGVSCAEVFFTTYSEYSAEFVRELLSKKGKMEAVSVHVLGTQFEPQLYSEHPRVRADAYYWLERAMKAAQTLGASYYTFHGLTRAKRTFRENLPRVSALTREISDYCTRFGVTLSFENVEWAFYNRLGIFRGLKQSCPKLKGVLDIKQARISGYDYRDYLSEMGHDISHVHVSDVDGNGKMCLPGRGTFDFDELFARLADVGFEGAILLENYGKDYGDFGQLKAAWEYLSEKAEKYA